MLNENIGIIDRIIRILAGIALLALVFIGPHTPWGYVGLWPLVTGTFGYCPLYALFRVSTLGSLHRIPKHA